MPQTVRFGAHHLRGEFAPMLRLAAPLALAELGWMAMGIVDTLMAGRLSPAAVGAGSLGSMIFYPIAISASGLLLGLDTLVAQSFGARDPADCRRSLVNGLWLALGLTPFVAAAMLAVIPLMRIAGVNPHVMALCVPYIHAIVWSVLPLMVYTACRRYLQAVNVVGPITLALVSANLINIAGNWGLMFGHWGLPAMGLTGSGWATSLSRLYMALVMLAAVCWYERDSSLHFLVSWRPDVSRLRRLLSLGAAAAGQMAFEGAVFGIVTVLAAKLDEASLAAHSVAVLVISTTFMVPLGISSAAAVRVGQAVGRRDPQGAAVAGWAALSLAALFMGIAGLALWIMPRLIVRSFVADAAVIAQGAILLRIAAFFELFDGLQVVATGALRGLGDTRNPMLAHLVGYWFIGLPVAYILCFPLGMGAAGIWIGLSLALILIGAALLLVWRNRQKDHSRLV
jgi:multidrug resistance protein, MATE family